MTKAAETEAHPTPLAIDQKYLLETLLELFEIPSPSGYTDNVVRFVCKKLRALGIDYELTRRGAIRANLKGQKSTPDRALVVHLDTLGAMVRQLKPNGRLAVVPIGTWSSRFAEGARVTVLSDHGSHRGSILPLKASGHTFGDEVDSQPVSWDQVEVRVDARVASAEDLAELGIAIGDYVAVDPQPEVTDSGYVVARHLDNKAGTSCLLAAAKAVVEARDRDGVELPVDCHLLFTIFEEVGSGASSILHQDVAEMVAVDNATPAPGQSSDEHTANVAMMDSFGPFDYHLTHKLIQLAAEHDVPLRRDVFRHYRCDAASAVEAGNDIRFALLCFGADASHGYERTHQSGLEALARLLALYMQSAPTAERDRKELGSLRGFTKQP